MPDPRSETYTLATDRARDRQAKLAELRDALRERFPADDLYQRAAALEELARRRRLRVGYDDARCRRWLDDAMHLREQANRRARAE